MIPLVDLKAEYNEYGNELDKAMSRVAASGQYILGPEVKQVETELAKIAQPEENETPLRCVAVSDGTAALQIALMALRIGPGDEVVTVPFTWISTVEVVAMVGATPVFCDVLPDGTMDAKKLEECVTPRTRAVIAVSLCGRVADLAAIRAVLDEAESKHWTRIALVEDAAQSFGAKRADGVRSCASPYATIATTSFFPTKPLGCLGDGGALFTTDTALANTARELRVHGKRDGRFHRVGLNSRLDTLQAAILLVKIPRFEATMQRRRTVATRYNELLKSERRVITPDEMDGGVWALYSIRVRERDAVLRAMKERGVGVAVYYPVCCHQQPVFAKMKVSMPVAESLATQVLALPMHPWLSPKTQGVVVDSLVKCLDEIGVREPPVL